MAVSHQWFVQWSSPAAVFAEISQRAEGERWAHAWGYRTAYAHSTAHGQDHAWDAPYQQQRVSAPAPVVRAPAALYENHNDYDFEYEEEQDLKHNGVNDGTRVAALALWVSLASLARAQHVPADTDTPPFSTLYKWKHVDFDFPSPKLRRKAISSGKFIPANVLPLGLEVWGSRVFLTLPSWRRGVPATLATVSRYGGAVSPPLEPYPDWSFHAASNNASDKCAGLTSVFRVNADPCGRLWVLDSGQVDSQDSPRQLCPPSVLVFDLRTDKLLARHPIPRKYVLQDSLFSNIVVDARFDDCSDLHVYIADTWRFGLIVFRESDKQFWRFSHHLFYPDPLASNYTLHGLNFQWADGIFGLALSPLRTSEERILFFHSMSSFREFYVSTEVLQDPLRVNSSSMDFNIVGESRGLFGQASASAIDRRGVMFYGLVTQDSVGCWNTKLPYTKDNMGVVATNSEALIFPNDIKVDQEASQSVWVISNRLPQFQAGELEPGEYNYRVLHASTEDAVRGSVCDPAQRPPVLSSDVLRKWIH